MAEIPNGQPNEGRPAPKRFLSGNSVLLGIAVGACVYILGYGLSALFGHDQQGYWALVWIVAGVLVSLVLFVVGVVLVIVERTRGFGAGLLISIAVGLVVGSGVCVALLSRA